MQPRIALIGYSGSGKTTLANTTDYTVLSFGKEVKRAVGRVLNRSVEYVEQQKHELRGVIQAVGHSVREYDNDYWIHPVITQLNDTANGFIIDDLRYEREAVMMRKEGFIIVRLMGVHRRLTGPESIHQSELEHLAIPFDYCIQVKDSITPETQLKAIIDERYY